MEEELLEPCLPGSLLGSLPGSFLLGLPGGLLLSLSGSLPLGLRGLLGAGLLSVTTPQVQICQSGDGMGAYPAMMLSGHKIAHLGSKMR